MPITPPPPSTADIHEVPCATFSAGSSSRMIPNESGKMAALTPCSARAATITTSELVRAATRMPEERAKRAQSRIRRRPKMSPRRPASGSATADASMKAVKTQVTPVWVVCRRCWSVGSAGTTSDCTSE